MQGFIDTHCHIHTAGSKRKDFTVKKWHDAGELNADDLLASAKAGGLSKLICVGTDYEDSAEAVDFVQGKEGCWASVGVHPHEAKQFLEKNKNLDKFMELLQPIRLDGVQGSKEKRTNRIDYTKSESRTLLTQQSVKSSGSVSSSARNQGRTANGVVAIGEVGLDYYYEHSPRKEQIRLLEMFLSLAQEKDLPLIFHVREAFDDFWPILANFNKIRGVLHSFTDSEENLREAIERRLYVGLNGIMTFTKDQAQLDMVKNIPLNSLLLETDAPYLAPKPLRGKICKPEYISLTYDFLCELRHEEKDDFILAIDRNVNKLFGI